MTELPSGGRAGVRQSAILATVVVVAVIGFIAFMQFARVGPPYAGLLFFWYWGAIGEAKLANLPSMLIGALVGVAIAWLLQTVSHAHSPAAMGGVILLIILAIYVQVMELWPVAVNLSTMLFLTVAGAPLLQGAENMPVLALSIVAAAIYFGLIVLVLSVATRGRVASGPPS